MKSLSNENVDVLGILVSELSEIRTYRNIGMYYIFYNENVDVLSILKVL